MGHHFTSAVIVMPDSMTLEQVNNDEDSVLFLLEVVWKGGHRYAIRHFGRDKYFDKYGVSKFQPLDRERAEYRFDSLEEAVQAAESFVDNIRINGMTWKEFSTTT